MLSTKDAAMTDVPTKLAREESASGTGRHAKGQKRNAVMRDALFRVRHGAKVTRKTCSHERCTNFVKKGGRCNRHRAMDAATAADVSTSKVKEEGPLCSLQVCHVVAESPPTIEYETRSETDHPLDPFSRSSSNSSPEFDLSLLIGKCGSLTHPNSDRAPTKK